MTSFIIRKTLTLIVVLAVGLVAYNYFLGDEEEQTQSKEIIAQVQGLTSSVASLLQSEKEKYDQGKYDDALSKMKTSFAVLRERAAALGGTGNALLLQLDDLQEKEQTLEAELQSLHIPDGAVVGASDNAGVMESDDSVGPSIPEASLERAEAIRRQLMELNRQVQRLSTDLISAERRE